jgi:hypothetical protein
MSDCTGGGQFGEQRYRWCGRLGLIVELPTSDRERTQVATKGRPIAKSRSQHSQAGDSPVGVPRRVLDLDDGLHA